MGLTVSRLIDSTHFSKFIHRFDSSKLFPTDSHPIYQDSTYRYHTQEYLSPGSALPVNNYADGVINLDPLIKAETGMDAFQAWHVVYNGYHNYDVIGEKVNVRSVGPSIDQIGYYETIQDIMPEEQLRRYRGIAYWFVFAVFMYSTQSNVAGYLKFFDSAVRHCDSRFHPIIKECIDWVRPSLNENIKISYTDPMYLQANDQFYTQIPYTQRLHHELVATMPSSIHRFLNSN